MEGSFRCKSLGR